VLLREWPAIRERVPGARLLLAGGGLPGDALPAGVEALGQLPAIAELWEQAAVLAFPCPASSGPKVKVLEAAMAGVPVLTTEYGVEGLHLEGVSIAPLSGFAQALAGVLADPQGRAAASTRIRASARARHAPAAAAAERVRAWRTSITRQD
jgi:glycosyltransferase involved in cell wall biosynthesis